MVSGSYMNFLFLFRNTSFTYHHRTTQPEITDWVHTTFTGGTRWHIWLRHCIASQKATGSIRFIGSFQWHNPAGRTIALISTKPVTEISTASISWSKGGRCIRLRSLPPSYSDCLKIWEPQFPGTLWVLNTPVQGLPAFKSGNSLNKQSGKLKGDVIVFKVCKSEHHQTLQINQPTRCNNFSSLLRDVYVQLNMFWASSSPSSGAQQLQ
jgi:hypothetical protein